MPNPIYKFEHLKPAFHLRYTWTGWPTAGTQFPPRPDEHFFEQLDTAWKSDHLKRIATNWQTDRIQFTFSTVPTVSPTLFVARVKGRLQHALRLSGTPVQFSRKVAFRGIGENHTREVENYIQQQVDKERFVDPKFSAMLKQFTIAPRTTYSETTKSAARHACELMSSSTTQLPFTQFAQPAACSRALPIRATE